MLPVALQQFGASYDYRSNELAATRLTELLYREIADNFQTDPFFGSGSGSRSDTRSDGARGDGARGDGRRPLFSRSLRAQQGVASDYDDGARGRPCGHVFSKDETVFRCRNCGMDDTCVLCQRCFRASDHEGHDVSMSINAGSGGCCDCGDAEAWRVDIACKYHGGARTTDDVAGPQLDQQTRTAIKASLSMMLDFVLNILYHARDSVRAPSLDDETDPQLDAAAARLTGEHYDALYDAMDEEAWSCVLWNDEKHNFEEVIDIVKRACKKNRAFGQSVANTVDKRGRATVYTGSLKEAVRIATMLGRIRLGVTVRSARDIFREDMIETIIAFLHDMANMHMTVDGVRVHGVMRTLICEALTEDWQRGVQIDGNAEAPSAFYDSEESDEPEVDMMDSAENEDLAQTLVQAILGENPADAAVDAEIDNDDNDDEEDDTLADTIRRFARRVNVPQTTTEHESLCPAHWRDTPRIPTTAKRSRLAQLMLRDLRLWKQARLSLRELYITTMVALPQFKSVMGTCFAQNYKELAEIYFFADREPEHSMIIFSVQLFTVPSITSMLVREHHFFSNLLAVLYTYFTTQKPGTPQDVDINTPVLSEVYTFRWKRHYHAINDLKYILNTKLVQEYIPQDEHIFAQFVDWLQLFQGMDAQRQMLGSHIEYESDNWISAFNLMLQLAKQVHAFGESFANTGPGKVRTEAASSLIDSITEWGAGELRERMPLFEPRGDIAQELTQLELRHLSFHHPLHWLLATIMSAMTDRSELRAVSADDLSRIIVFSIRTILWTWEIRCRQWVRNGQSIVAQMWHYTEPGMREYCIDKDVRLVQIMLAIDPALGFRRVREVADVVLRFDYGGDDPRMVQMLHHRTLFYIALLQERAWMTHVSGVDTMSRELRHALAFGAKSYSDLVKLVSDRFAEDPAFEAALGKVADFKAPSGLDDTGTYALRREEYAAVDPYFYHYSRSQTEECLEILRKRFGPDWTHVPQLQDIAQTAWAGLTELTHVRELSEDIVLYLEVTNELGDESLQAREALTDAVLHLCLLILTQTKVIATRGTSLSKPGFVDVLQNSPRLSKAHAVKLKHIHALTRELFQATKREPDTSDTKEEETEFARKKALAKARQARLMNEMQASQSAFMQNQILGDTDDEEEVEEEIEDGRYRFPSGNCMVCQRPLSVDTSRSMYGILATIQDSRLDRRTPNLADHPALLRDILEHPLTMDRDSDWLPAHQPDFPSHHAAQRDSITTCGHIIHWDCFESFSNSFKNELLRLSTLGRNVPLRMEFQCPLCQTVGNVFVPIYARDKAVRALQRAPQEDRPMAAHDFAFHVEDQPVPSGAVTADMGLESAIALYTSHRNDVRLNKAGQLYERDAGMLAASVVDAEIALRDRSHNHSRAIEPLCLVEGLTEQTVLALRAFAEAIRRRSSMALAAATSPPVALTGPLDTPGGNTARHLVGYLANMRSTYEHRLSQLFDPLADPKTRALLYEDTFAVLTELLLCRPEGADSAQLLGVLYEAEIVKVVLVCRQTVDAQSPIDADDALDRDVDEFGRWCQATFYQSYKDDDLRTLLAVTRRYALAFLRKAAVLLHVVCMAEYPVEDASLSDLSELDRLTTLLGVRPLGEVCSSAAHLPRQALMRDWLRKIYVRHINDGDTHVYLSHPLPFTLAHLPRELDRLLDDCLHRTCPNCEQVPSQPAVCLLCGALVCFQTQCCYNQQAGVGECTTHRQSCGGSVGIYFIPKRASLLFLRHESGAFVPPPYLDVHGETDPDLKRGKPQFLSRKRYEVGVRQLYLKHGVATLLARKYETMPDIGGFTTL